jgi:hypothetical protein
MPNGCIEDLVIDVGDEVKADMYRDRLKGVPTEYLVEELRRREKDGYYYSV